jgi:sugar phosphate isomerase/epimerase
MNRRTFLDAAARGAVSGLCLAALNSQDNIAFAGKITRVGLQLYTLRNQMQQDVEGTLARVAQLGYQEVEFAGYQNKTPQQIRDLLKKNGLAAPSAHFPLSSFADKTDKIIGVARSIGHNYLVCPWLEPAQRQTLDDYKKLAAILNKAGAECKKAGIQLAYHNHDFEFAPLDGRLPFDLLLAETDAKLVKIELDLYWITKAGHDPLAYFAKHPGRFPLVHVKDMDNTPQKSFTEVGRGTIDFKKIFAQSGQAGIRHYFVEQDQCPGSPFDSIKVSVDYLKQLTF